MTRHAFLIMCHKSDYNLLALIKSIDDPRNDIYIMVDAKVKNFDFQCIKIAAKYSAVNFVPRTKIYWGGYSLIKGEMILFEAAVKNGGYSYYHLLSGQDLCIKTQDCLHEFFDKHPDSIYMEVDINNKWSISSYERIRYYYLQSGRRNIIFRAINKISIKVQKLFRVNRVRDASINLAGGSEWCSLPHDFVEYLVSKEKYIKKHFNHGYLVDEVYKQTMFINSIFTDKLYLNNDGNPDNLRLIDWSRGSPYVFQESDYNELISSNAFFARKFTYSPDNKVVDMILSSNGIE